VAILDLKEMKAATAIGGVLGKGLRSISAGGRIAYAIGSDIPAGRFGQPTNIWAEYEQHLGVMIQFSLLKWRWLVIPKQDVLEWGVLERGAIPGPRPTDHSSAIAGALLYGPIGLLVGSSMDSAAAKKRDAKPVIGITYREGGSEHAIFLEFTLASYYHNLNDFLLECFPEQHRE
jgi:hypothetical protein